MILKRTAALFLLLHTKYSSALALSEPPVGDHGSADNNIQGSSYQFAIVSDLDQKSRRVDKSTNLTEWVSLLRTGHVNFNPASDEKIVIVMDTNEATVLKVDHMNGARGQEFSELINFKGQLLTCDDHTGIVYQLSRSVTELGEHWIQTPWPYLTKANATVSLGLGFKCEWATVKDDHLWIGSQGIHPIRPKLKQVKEITAAGLVTTHDWSQHYKAIAHALHADLPGYVLHEAVGWSAHHKKWVFIPRKVISCPSSNCTLPKRSVLVIASEDYGSIEIHPLKLNGSEYDVGPGIGGSSFKWIPGTNDSYILALFTFEQGFHQKTFFVGLDMQGNVLLPKTEIENNKYEGLEFY